MQEQLNFPCGLRSTSAGGPVIKVDVGFSPACEFQFVLALPHIIAIFPACLLVLRTSSAVSDNSHTGTAYSCVRSNPCCSTHTHLPIHVPLYPPTYPFTHPCTPPSTQLSTHLPIHPSTYPPTHPFTHPPTHPSSHPTTHILTHLHIHPTPPHSSIQVVLPVFDLYRSLCFHLEGNIWKMVGLWAWRGEKEFKRSFSSMLAPITELFPPPNPLNS